MAKVSIFCFRVSIYSKWAPLELIWFIPYILRSFWKRVHIDMIKLSNNKLLNTDWDVFDVFKWWAVDYFVGWLWQNNEFESTNRHMKVKLKTHFGKNLILSIINVDAYCIESIDESKYLNFWHSLKIFSHLNKCPHVKIGN